MATTPEYNDYKERSKREKYVPSKVKMSPDHYVRLNRLDMGDAKMLDLVCVYVSQKDMWGWLRAVYLGPGLAGQHIVLFYDWRDVNSCPILDQKTKYGAIRMLGKKDASGVDIIEVIRTFNKMSDHNQIFIGIRSPVGMLSTGIRAVDTHDGRIAPLEKPMLPALPDTKMKTEAVAAPTPAPALFPSDDDDDLMLAPIGGRARDGKDEKPGGREDMEDWFYNLGRRDMEQEEEEEARKGVSFAEQEEERQEEEEGEEREQEEDQRWEGQQEDEQGEEETEPFVIEDEGERGREEGEVLETAGQGDIEWYDPNIIYYQYAADNMRHARSMTLKRGDFVYIIPEDRLLVTDYDGYLRDMDRFEDKITGRKTTRIPKQFEAFTQFYPGYHFYLEGVGKTNPTVNDVAFVVPVPLHKLSLDRNPGKGKYHYSIVDGLFLLVYPNNMPFTGTTYMRFMQLLDEYGRPANGGDPIMYSDRMAREILNDIIFYQYLKSEIFARHKKLTTILIKPWNE